MKGRTTVLEIYNMPNKLFVGLLDKRIKESIKEKEDAEEKSKSAKNTENNNEELPPIDPNLMQDELEDILEGGE